MKSIFLVLIALTGCLAGAPAIDSLAFGNSMGQWKGNRVSYRLSGSDYRTYLPEITPTPDGGIFVSIRIDHVRGWLASDDHAVLEVTISPDASIVSAQSSLAFQGRSISSDVIREGTDAGTEMGNVSGAVKICADLVSDLSSKMLRERIVEPGRVGFPAVIRHNYNLLFQAIRLNGSPLPVPEPVVANAEQEEPPVCPASPETKTVKISGTAKLEIKPLGKAGPAKK